ncbi:MAG: hypothetical protein EOR95_01080 [Mesorhizobium sp.]|nr:MAG: hypothetical protein EOR95_01080 [Mesorhizobium sp.]
MRVLTDSNVRSAPVLESHVIRFGLMNSLPGFTQAPRLTKSSGFIRCWSQSFCGRRPKVAGFRP